MPVAGIYTFGFRLYINTMTADNSLDIGIYKHLSVQVPLLYFFRAAL